MITNLAGKLKGRFHRKFEGDIKMDIKQTGGEYVDCVPEAYDDSQQRAVVNSATDIRVSQNLGLLLIF
jgi:hypothetical protein